MFKNLNPSALGVSGHQSEIIELALTYGFAGIDLNMVEFAARVRLKGMPYARRLIDSAKIRVGTFPLPLEWDTDDETFQKELKKLPEYAECAAELGCTAMHGRAGPGRRQSALPREFRVPSSPLPRYLRGLEADGRPVGRGLSGGRKSPPQSGLPVHPRSRRLDLAVEHGGGAERGPAVGYLGSRGLRRIGRSRPQSCRLEQIVAVQVADMPADVPLADLDEKVAAAARRRERTDRRGRVPGQCCGRWAMTGRSRSSRRGAPSRAAAAKWSSSRPRESLDKVWRRGRVAAHAAGRSLAGVDG